MFKTSVLFFLTLPRAPKQNAGFLLRTLFSPLWLRWMPGPCCPPTDSHSNPHCLGRPHRQDGIEDRPWRTPRLSHSHQLKDRGVTALISLCPSKEFSRDTSKY